jgi:hypothetical protein
MYGERVIHPAASLEWCCKQKESLRIMIRKTFIHAMLSATAILAASGAALADTAITGRAVLDSVTAQGMAITNGSAPTPPRYVSL